GVSSEEVTQMAQGTGCSSSSFPFTYLGLPIGSNMGRISNRSILIDRFKARLSRWKANMLSAEDKAPTPQVFTIQKGRDNKPKPQANKKVKGKGKADKNTQFVPYQPKSKPNPLKRKENPNKDQACHHCHIVGHWKRNCPLYLEELRANKK
nr:zinc finger, CCHC-type [Tanacetum cinerariifolium]